MRVRVRVVIYLYWYERTSYQRCRKNLSTLVKICFVASIYSKGKKCKPTECSYLLPSWPTRQIGQLFCLFYCLSDHFCSLYSSISSPYQSTCLKELKNSTSLNLVIERRQSLNQDKRTHLTNSEDCLRSMHVDEREEVPFIQDMNENGANWENIRLILTRFDFSLWRMDERFLFFFL